MPAQSIAPPLNESVSPANADMLNVRHTPCPMNVWTRFRTIDRPRTATAESCRGERAHADERALEDLRVVLCAQQAHTGAMTKDERLTVRVTREQLDLFKDAAELQSQTVSDFALTTLTAKAHDVMAEQRVFLLSGERWEELLARLDERPTARPNLADALRMHAKQVLQ